MKMLTIAKFPHDTLSTITANLVSAARRNQSEVSVSIQLEPKQVEKIVNLLTNCSTTVSEANAS